MLRGVASVRQEVIVEKKLITNNNVSLWTKLYWRVYIILIALLWIPQVNLGDEVWYRARRYRISNGVRYNSWRLSGLYNDDDGWVDRLECKKVWSFRNMKHSFQSGYRFYMDYWFDIWCRKGIEDWMRSANIWHKTWKRRK